MMDSTHADNPSGSTPAAYPLSFGQHALWSLHQAAPESVAYNLSGAVAVPGDTDLHALRRAFQRLAKRHPMLRTIFAAPDGEPEQRILPEADVDFCSEDASGWSPERLDERLAAETYRPFDLERHPAWRVLALERAPLARESSSSGHRLEHLILLVFHHILGDLWSIAVMMSEVAALYREETASVEAALKPLRARYADFVRQEAERLAGPQDDASWAFWGARLSGDLPLLDLPADRPRLSTSTGRGAAQVIVLDRELTERLRALARTRRVALYTVLLSAFQTLLHRYTGQEDILVGFPKAGRSHTVARVVGYFVNTVVMRATFTEQLRFDELLQLNQRAVEESAAHDWYPFARVVQRLRPAREFGRSPIFQAMFTWQKTTALLPEEQAGFMALGQGADAVDPGGLVMRSIPIAHRVAPVDLTLAAADGPSGLVATLEYRTDLFDAATIERMAQSYRVLLTDIASRPEQRIFRLQIMPDAARQALVEGWNATTRLYPHDLRLHQFVERQAELAPETLALVAGEAHLTYRALNQQANRLAHYLRQQGIGPDIPVGLLCARSTQALIGLLAILKAGGAYVPLDPSYPDERLAFMLRDSDATLLLTERGLDDRLARLRMLNSGDALSGMRVLVLGSESADARLIAAQSADNPSCVVTPDHLAYLIYTSGSTGWPNGVALTHRGVVSLLSDFQRRGPLGPGDGCSWWTSLSFDVSVYEIFSAWFAGATLHVVPEHVRLDAPALLTWLQTHQIHGAYLPPFLLNDYARWLGANPGATALRRLLVGVEPIPERLLRTICAQAPKLCLLNGYGPSETTICSTLYQVKAPPPGASAPSDAAPAHQRTPIGRPVDNTHIYLLDRLGQPVPVGAVGEVYIGGVGLARGYWRRPELTAERFLPDPFCVRTGGQSGEEPDGRMYRTGDLARMLVDGNLEYVGRRDGQVKLRGYRIELGEIEAALAQHPNVKQAAVLLCDDEGKEDKPLGGRRLVAYVTPMQDPSPAPDELRRFLAQRLPHAMLPTTFAVLEAFPLTPSGKVDWRTLAASIPPQSERISAVQAPRTDVERLLVTLWQEALGVEQVGLNDNFFELGGDSILALQIIARAAAAGLRLTPRQLFESPTVAGLAALAEVSTPRGGHSEQGILEGDVPLTAIQRWFFEREFPNPHHWNQALLFLTRQPLNSADLRAAVGALLERHDALRLRYSRDIRTGIGWRQFYAGLSVGSPETIPCEVIDLSSLSALEQATALEAHAAALQRSLNLFAGPLIRVAYFTLGATRPGRLLVIIHHLAIDGVSWRILIEDLQTAYRHLQSGQPIQLLPKTTSYREWAQRLIDLAQSSELREEANFWLSCAGADCPMIPVNAHTADGGLQAMYTEGGAQRVSVRISREETQALLRVAPTRYAATINAVLLTALVRAVQRWTGSSSLWLDLEGHGREEIVDGIDLTRSVGWFTALYPVRLNLPPSNDHDHAVRAINDQLLRIPRHGVGYGLLRYLRTDPALAERIQAVPPAQIAFNYLGHISPLDDRDVVALSAPESVGLTRSPDAPRSHLLDIEVAVIQGELHIDWTYSPEAHHRHMVEQVASFFLKEARTLAADGGAQTLASGASSGSATRSATAVHQAGPDRTADQAPLLRLADRDVKENRTKDHSEGYQLSPMQQGMLFHTLLAPTSGVYIEQITCDMQGVLDITAFERAWRRVFERHTMLRSSFLWREGDHMLQIVHNEVMLPVEFLDWRALPPAERKSQFVLLLAAERSRGFDLARAPLMRITLARRSEDRYRFLLTYHHAVLDGWSVALLFQEVLMAYTAITRQEELSLLPARPYKDYIDWLQAQDLEAAETFWRKALAGSTFVSTAPFLPLQRASTPIASVSQPVEADEWETRLSTQTTAVLHAFAKKHGLTPNTLVQGALALLLSHYAQQEEVTFGVTVAGRPPALSGIEQMIGLFINTLPLRVRVDAHASVVEWLQRLQRQASEIRQYDYSPLVQIQNWSERPRGAPLFDMILVFENYPIDAVLHEQMAGVRIEHVRALERIHYPLAIVATPGPQLRLRAVYDAGRFELEAMARLLSDLRRLLESMVTDPDQCLAALSVPMAPHASERWEQTQAVAAPEQVAVQAFCPAEKPLERYLASLWKELLEQERIGIHDDFFELGGNSLIGAAFINRLYATMQEEVALTAIFEAPTIAALANYLERRHPDAVARLLGQPVGAPSARRESAAAAAVSTAAAPARRLPRLAPLTPALVAIQPNGTRPPLFCIHPAGGVVFPYYTLASYLGKDQPLYGLQDPHLYLQRVTFHSIEDMAAHYVRELQTVQPEGPYHLLGWSVGGLVAYEMAQQLTRNGQVVAALIMLDTASPAHSALQASLVGSRRHLQRMWARVWGLPTGLRVTGASVRPILNYVRSGLYLLTASARRQRRVRAPTDRASTQGPTLLDLFRWAWMDTWRARLFNEADVADTVSQETSLLLIELPTVRRVLDLVWEHKRLARRYVAAIYSGRITLFRAAPAEPRDRHAHNALSDWGSLAAGGVETHAFHANHVALLVKPHAEAVAHEVRGCLEHSYASLEAGADDQRDAPETNAADPPSAAYGDSRQTK